MEQFLALAHILHLNTTDLHSNVVWIQVVCHLAIQKIQTLQANPCPLTSDLLAWLGPEAVALAWFTAAWLRKIEAKAIPRGLGQLWPGSGLGHGL